MSGNAELVRRSYDAWNAGDLAACLEMVHPEAEYRTSGIFPDFDPVYRGREGFAEFWRRMREPWERFQIDVEDIEEDGDRVVVAVRFRATGVDSSANVDMRFAHAMRIRDGMVAQLISRPTIEDARAALDDSSP